MQMQRQNYYTDFIPTGAAMLAETIAETNSSNKKTLTCHGRDAPLSIST